MRMIQRFRNRGFTLVELMIVVAIIGVLAALAIYGVRRYLASAKTSEAKNSLGAIARGAVGAFEAETTVGRIVPLAGTGNTFSHDVCGNAQTVPTNISRITGRKYQPDPTDGSDFETGDATTGWKCLKYNMSSPQYYQYHYQADRRDGGSDGSAPADPAGLLDPPTPGFGAYALGDLDGDGTLSGFGQIGEVDGGTQSLRLATEIRVVDEFE